MGAVTKDGKGEIASQYHAVSGKVRFKSTKICSIKGEMGQAVSQNVKGLSLPLGPPLQLPFKSVSHP